MTSLLSARRVAESIGMSERRLHELAAEGWIPRVPYGKQYRYDAAAVAHAVAELRHKRNPRPGFKRCYVCTQELPIEAFPSITVRDRRCKPGHARTGPASECRDCRKEQRREWRRKRAAAEGRTLGVRGGLNEWHEKLRAARLERKRHRRVAYAVCLAFRALVKLSPEEKARRAVARQRVRYNTDPVYQANRKALKIRRKRAQTGTQVIPVNRELVAKRDGWCCGICGGIVTRSNWSLDHVIPLSKGGPHTYANVVLAHRRCNSKRGPGRLPVQAALFALLDVPARPVIAG